VHEHFSSGRERCACSADLRQQPFAAGHDLVTPRAYRERHQEHRDCGEGNADRDCCRHANPHFGWTLDQQQRAEEAIRELTAAANADPAYADPHYVLARIYRRQGESVRADDALATFKRLSGARHQDEK